MSTSTSSTIVPAQKSSTTGLVPDKTDTVHEQHIWIEEEQFLSHRIVEDESRFRRNKRRLESRIRTRLRILQGPFAKELSSGQFFEAIGRFDLIHAHEQESKKRRRHFVMAAMCAMASCTGPVIAALLNAFAKDFFPPGARHAMVFALAAGVMILGFFGTVGFGIAGIRTLFASDLSPGHLREMADLHNRAFYDGEPPAPPVID